MLCNVTVTAAFTPRVSVSVHAPVEPKGERDQRNRSHAQAWRKGHHRRRHPAGVRRCRRLHPGRAAVMGRNDCDIPGVSHLRFGVRPHQGKKSSKVCVWVRESNSKEGGRGGGVGNGEQTDDDVPTEKGEHAVFKLDSRSSWLEVSYFIVREMT